jgi:hypothetical protein
MNMIRKILTLCVLAGLLTHCAENPQNQQKEQTITEEIKSVSKQDTVKQMNLLDQQTEVFSNIFGMMDHEEAQRWKDLDGFIDLVERSELSSELKTQLTEQYKLYDLSLDPAKKDSLKIVFNQMLAKAMAESSADMD